MAVRSIATFRDFLILTGNRVNLKRNVLSLIFDWRNPLLRLNQERFSDIFFLKYVAFSISSPMCDVCVDLDPKFLYSAFIMSFY